MHPRGPKQEHKSNGGSEDGVLNSSCTGKQHHQFIKQQCLQVHQPLTMQKLIIFLAFSNLVLSLPVEDKVEVVEAKEAKDTVDQDDEAARNARFNFGYSIQVSFDSF